MRSLLFVNKKKQKNFDTWLYSGPYVCDPPSRTVRRIAGAPASIQPSVKVFLVLFVHKKNKNLILAQTASAPA